MEGWQICVYNDFLMLTVDIVFVTHEFDKLEMVVQD